MRPQAARVVVGVPWLRRLSGDRAAAVCELFAGLGVGESMEVRLPGEPASVWVPVYGEGVVPEAVYTVEVGAVPGRGLVAELVAL